MPTKTDWKARAVEQWTADPCGPATSGVFALMEARRAYAPWMAEQIDYEGTAGLEVLDVGCGQGIDLCELGLAGARVTGIDLTPRHIELARLHAQQAGIDADIVEGDAEQLPFESDSFDRVVSNGVLHHMPDIEAALREIRRVLRPGGRFTVLLYNRNSWHYWLNQLLWRGVLKAQLVRQSGMSGVLSTGVECSSIGARPLVRVYSRRQVARMLKRAGFRSAAIWVSPFRPEDSPFTRLLPESAPLGGGWFLVGHAR